jgi:TRAP-type C4-dicarboxylate transport system substrate-binding protein
MKIMKAFLIFSVLLALVFFTVPASTLAEKVIEIKAATFHPVAHYLTEDAFRRYGEEVEKRTKGKVKFKWFFAGSLAKGPQLVSAVESGLADMAFGGTWAIIHKMPITSWLELPFVVDSSRHAADIAWDMYLQIPEMQKEYKKVKFLGFFNTSICHISTLSEPVKNLEDLKGKRIATPSPTGVKTMKHLGISPQRMIPPDLYMAIHRNMIDGVLFPMAPLRSYKLTDLLANHTVCSVYSGANAIIMNKNTWKKLPPDVQKVFNDLRQSVGSLCGETLTTESAWVLEGLKARGDKVYVLTDEEKARWKVKVKPMYKEWIAKMNKRGMNGQEIFNKIMKIAEERRENPYKADSWWGEPGKKRTK